MSTIKPIFLLADSQLLFWRDDDVPFLRRARALLDEDGDSTGGPPKAAYLGASNGDAPEFYDLFVAAMEMIGIRDCRLIPTRPGTEDLDFLASANLILLAGGDVERGWKAFKEAGLDQKLIERYYGGALLVGVSAGAVQLGLKGWDDGGERTLDMLRIVPFVVDVHDEPSWARLLRAVPKAGEHGRGLGIPSGAGALYHPDYSVEPVRQPLVEVSQTETGVRQALLLPGEISAPSEPAALADSAAPSDSPASFDSANPASTSSDADSANRARLADPSDIASPSDSASPAGGANAAGRADAPDASMGDAAGGTRHGEQRAGRIVESQESQESQKSHHPQPDPKDQQNLRRELGYTIRPDGIIEVHRPNGSDESVN